MTAPSANKAAATTGSRRQASDRREAPLGLRTLTNLWRQLRVLSQARENRLDFPRWLIRRPMTAVAVGAGEMAETFSNRVDFRLKLLAQSRAASMVGCEFCLDVSSALAHKARIDERKLLELHEFETSGAFNETERLVLRFATLLSETPAQRIPEELRVGLTERLGKAGLLELSAAIAHEHQRTRLYLALGMRPARFAPEDACPIPTAVPAGR